MRFDATSYEMGRQAGGGGGGSAVIESITITQNGITTAPSGVDGYSPITVEVAAPAINLQNKSVSANGTYTADQGYDGLGQVVVNVAGGQNQYDLTGNIDGVFASPQATQWFGANYAYINSITNITSMKATFQGVSAFPNKPITIASSGAECKDTFKGVRAASSSIPVITGKLIGCEDMFADTYIGTVDLSHATTELTPQTLYGGLRFGNNNCHITTLIMPSSIQVHSPYAYFNGNNTLENITLPNTITYYDPYSWNDGEANAIFAGCKKLRSVPMAFLTEISALPCGGSSTSCIYNNCFRDCNILDEIVNLPVRNNIENWGNAFDSIVNECNHLKRFTFASYNGTVNWDGFVLTISYSVGYGNWQQDLPAAKEITDDASYALLKNDPDAWTRSPNYSRYNHDSAVETINSLPEMEDGYTCSIKFDPDSGTKTDGGKVGNLTSAEIAVATSKGWTVAYEE